MKNPAARIAQLLALAVSAQSIGSVREAQAATCGAARVAATYGVDILPLADAANLCLLCTIPWTEGVAPAGLMVPRKTVVCDDGSSLVIMEHPTGIYIERMSDDATGNRYLGRGFWRDCDVQEAVWLARDVWAC